LLNVHLFDQHFHLGDAAPVLAPGTARYYSLSYPPNFADPSLLGRWVKDGAPYVVLQVCAANNRVGYKNWPVEKWVEFLRLIESGYPSTVIFVVGDRNETEYGAAMEAAGLPGVRFLVGKTDYRELATLVAHASHYIGLDSGTMHLAAMMGKPTFVLWGASDAYTIGYGVFDPIRHVDLSAGLPCQPCYSWIRPNRSLVDNPLKCPDYRCIRDMPVLSVWEAYVRFVEQNGLAADH
jgi:ADP-heptose:LPS heptosyltransferase